MDAYQKIFRSVRVWLMIVSVVLSLLLITNIIGINSDQGAGFGNGLDYGLDITGGVEMWLKLDEPVEPYVMTLERNVLENRLNALGLKDIPVTPWGDQYIVVKTANASSKDIAHIEETLKQQANFEQMIDGELAVRGDEISLDLGPTGSGIYELGSGFEWTLLVNLKGDGAVRFGDVASGKFYGEDNPSNRPVDIFIDRPQNTTLLMTQQLYGFLSNITSTYDERDDIYFGDSAVYVIEKRSGLPIVIVNEADINQTLSELEGYKSEGYSKAIIAEDATRITEKARNLVEDIGVSTRRIPSNESDVEGWIRQVTGLKTSPKLNFDTRGEPVYKALLSGTAQTAEEAQNELEQNQAWLTSGNLPVKLSVESKSIIPASLGAQFLYYTFLAGLVAILFVALLVFLRYKKPFIAVPVMITGLSEVAIILGVASILNWEIDLPAIAGIIAAVGTGVDNQIVITDETLAAAESQEKKTESMAERIRRAFFIIFTSATTLIAVMLPLLVFVAGMLKGFALITMIGVISGIFITRPAYARIIEELIKDRK